MVVTEITLVGWLISTPTSGNPTLWFIAAFDAVVLGVGIYLVHRQVERRIDQIGKLWAMDLLAGIILLAVVVLFVGIALDAAYHK